MKTITTLAGIMVISLYFGGCSTSSTNTKPQTVNSNEVQVEFGDIDYEDYEYGILYVEIKKYTDNRKLAVDNDLKTQELPVITMERTKKGLLYSFTGYNIAGDDQIEIMNTKVIYTNEDYEDGIKELPNELKITRNDYNNLIRNINDDFVNGNGSDDYGKYTVQKKIFCDESDEINDKFKLFFALIVQANFQQIPESKITRQLYYYLLELTY